MNEVGQYNTITGRTLFYYNELALAILRSYYKVLSRISIIHILTVMYLLYFKT